MENFEYTCHYCGKSYVPRRRHVQRYCRTSCRVNAFNLRNKVPRKEKITGVSIPHKEEKNQQTLSWGGIGDAAIANLATGLAKSLLTQDKDKPATKGDLQDYFNKSQQRYLPVNNVKKRNDGTVAYYDTVINQVVYLKQ